MRTTRGASTTAEASLTYHGSKARVDGYLSHLDGGTSAAFSLDGGIAVTERGVFLSNRIDDAFAVVDSGDADVPVFLENRLVGRTGADGKLLVPGLRSYETNRLRVDPLDLPINAEIRTTKFEIVPADRNGVIVDVDYETRGAAALVGFHAADGNPLPVGSLGVINATGETFVVGYDGIAYITDLSADNTATVTTPNGVCSAVFRYQPLVDQQVVVGGVICT
ncbi:MAG: fimbria/pilus outer membrane usher protein [Alphaproteobacteria bacterium]